MHIPDGALGPETYGITYGIMLPLWAVAGRTVKRRLRSRQVPLLAIGAAFCFVIMMFNVPLPGGSTGHATGAPLLALLLGPWAALLAVSVVLAVQALVFGDGGITTLAANSLTMAVIASFAASGTFWLLTRRGGGRWRTFAAGMAGYVGAGAAGTAAGILLGLQPLLAHTADGRPLYFPYGLRISVTAMAGGYLLVFGFVEAAVTALAYAYLARTDPELMAAHAGPASRARVLWSVVIILALLTPLGLWLPGRFHAGAGWGEWSLAAIKQRVGFVPRGMAHEAGRWSAPAPDYAPPGTRHFELAYVASALAGLALCGGALWLLGRRLARGNARARAGSAGVSPACSSCNTIGRDPSSLPGLPQPPASHELQAGETPALPLWLSAPPPLPPVPRRRASHLLRRFFTESAHFIEHTLFAERAARRPGFLQHLDARVKLLSVLGLLVAATFLHHLPSLWLIGAFALTALLCSRLPLALLCRRELWLVPALLALVALPAATRAITPGRALLVLHRAPELSLTQPGLASALLFISRIAVAVLLASLLALTTQAQALLRAGFTSVTAPFVFTLAMMHRYLFLLLRTAEELHLAKQARTITPDAVEQRRWVGGSAAFLFTRSRRLADEVYQAMLARGYTGRPKALVSSRFGAAEARWLIACTAVLTAALVLDHSFLRSLPW